MRTDILAAPATFHVSQYSLPLVVKENYTNRLWPTVAHSYQYTFAPNPSWSRVYAGALEIHKYLKDVATKYSATRFIKLSHQVVDVDWHQDVSKW